MATKHEAKSRLAKAWGWRRVGRVSRASIEGLRRTWREETVGLAGGSAAGMTEVLFQPREPGVLKGMRGRLDSQPLQGASESPVLASRTCQPQHPPEK